MFIYSYAASNQTMPADGAMIIKFIWTLRTDEILTHFLCRRISMIDMLLTTFQILNKIACYLLFLDSVLQVTDKFMISYLTNGLTQFKWQRRQIIRHISYPKYICNR